MKRPLSLVALFIGLLAVPVVRAQAALERVVAGLPDETVAFLTIPDLGELDANLQRIISRLKLEPYAPPPTNSLAGTMKSVLGMSEGLDEKGPVTAVLLPTRDPMHAMEHVAVIVPAIDPVGLLRAMGGQPGEEGGWQVMIQQMPMVAVIGDKRVVFSTTPETARKVNAGPGGNPLSKRLTAEDMQALRGLNLALWVDGERAVDMLRAHIDGLLGMFMMMQTNAGELGARQAQGTREQVEIWLKGTRSLVLGASVSPEAVGLRMYCSARPDSELAKFMPSKNADGSLLSGLPAGDFMLAMGGLAVPEVTRRSLEMWRPYLQADPQDETVDAAAIGETRDAAFELLCMMTGVRFSVDSLPEGAQGMLGVTLLFDCADSGKALQLMHRTYEAARRISKDEEVIAGLELLTYKEKAEEVAGVPVQHYVVDIGKHEGASDEDREEMKAILGEPAITVRAAAVNGQRVALAFGGGPDRMAKVIEAARSDAAPLASDPGVQRVRKSLPDKLSSECYFALDRIMRFVGRAARAVGEEPPPFDIPTLNAPLAMAGHLGERSTQTDIYVPMDLIAAVKDAATGMMGMQGGAAEQEQF